MLRLDRQFGEELSQYLVSNAGRIEALIKRYALAGQGKPVRRDIELGPAAMALAQNTALLDPAQISLPRLLRFRAPQSFTDSGFERLKRSIAHTGGNVQHIKVQPPIGGRYDLVAGLRRVRACAELGLPVAAVVEDVSGTRALQELDASNEDTQVSQYERGCLYASALKAGYFPSRRRLAEALGRTLKDVSDAITIAELPAVILDNLVDPRVLKVSIAKRLAAAAAADPEAVERRLVQAKVNRSTRMADLVKALCVTAGEA